MNPLFGVASGRFLGWWSEDDLVWRDATGTAIGYLEAAYGPWSLDDDGNPVAWTPRDQFYTLYRFEPGATSSEGIMPVGEVLSSLPELGSERAGRFRNCFSGLGRRAVPGAAELVQRPVPPRPVDREPCPVHPGLVDPEPCLAR